MNDTILMHSHPNSDEKHMNLEVTTTIDDSVANSHRTVALTNRNHHYWMLQYDLLISGHIREPSHEWIIPFDIIAICKSYLPVEFRIINETKQSNFYTKTYQAYNIFDNPIGPLIIDDNQRRRKVIIHNLYTFIKNSYIDGDTHTDITEYKLIQYQINQPILNKSILIKNGNITVRLPFKVKCNDILNTIANMYGTNMVDIKQQFKDIISVDLTQWFK
mmetsp:Transcript_11197/g.10050  ORF Transcript_11197/g.10050 Transcript_11197/m.10050 type:complete len:218 (+) Transcript_11197:35-688(+)